MKGLDVQIEQFALRHIQTESAVSINSIPADGMSRQAWQEAVEAFVPMVQGTFGDKNFKLTSAEISICYHLPLGGFVDLLAKKLS
jgi:hypothetical protein